MNMVVAAHRPPEQDESHGTAKAVRNLLSLRRSTVKKIFDGLLRASNTQPVLVMRFEAESPEALERIRAEFTQALGRFPFVQVPEDVQPQRPNSPSDRIGA